MSESDMNHKVQLTDFRKTADAPATTLIHVPLSTSEKGKICINLVNDYDID